MKRVYLKEINITNLRGFFNARLDLDRTRSVLVGRNNSGKTSLLLLLNWLVNEASPDVLDGSRGLTDEERDLLLPSRSARHRARRMRITIHIPEGSPKRKRFKCDEDGFAKFIFGYRVSEERAALRLLPSGRDRPSRSHAFETDDAALELLDYLRENIQVVLIPSFRDVGSNRFDETIREAYMARLEERALHPNRRGAPKEKQQINTMLDDLKKLTSNLVQPLWDDISKGLPSEMTKEGKVEFTASGRDLIEWVIENLDLRVSTGKRDSSKVGLGGVGSGLQSLFDLVIHSASIQDGDGQTILIVEEPEAFLHPTAQRIVARNLLRSQDADSIVVTTHSPLIVDETSAGDVVVVKDHRFYMPSEKLSDNREEINTALMTGDGSEAMFSDSVLLVEGESDQAFFESLRRRIADVDPSGRADRVHVIATGGKQQFSPWISLFRSYLLGNQRPIQYLIAPDADAGGDVMRAFNDAGVTVAQLVRDQINAMGSDQWEKGDWGRESVAETNALCRENGLQVQFLNTELEPAMFARCDDDFIQKVSAKAIFEAETTEELVEQALSKKWAWVRTYVGEEIPQEQLTDNVKRIIRGWLGGVMEKEEAVELMSMEW